MSESAMMQRMANGMAGKPLMPATTAPSTAMRGYDLGPIADTGPVAGVQFDKLRNPVQSLQDFFKLLGD
jgi:hypothetical protein